MGIIMPVIRIGVKPTQYAHFSIGMNSLPNAPWKEGSERSERWKENLGEGFLPRVSQGNMHNE